MPLPRKSKLDGEEAGGFVVVNVDNPHAANGLMVCETERGQTTFSTLVEARQFCRRSRLENRNPAIYVYALVGVADAVRERNDVFLTG